MAKIFELIDSRLKDEEEGLLTRILNQHELLIFPTETFYGLGGLVFFHSVYQKIFDLKGRQANKPLPFCASDLDMVLSFIEKPPASFFRLARTFWPGPMTLVLRAREGLIPESLPWMGQTIAVRVPSPSWLRQLIQKAGALLISTSANLSGQPPLSSFDEVYRTFAGQVGFFINGGETPGGKPSTIVDLAGPEPVCLREGKIPLVEIQHVLLGD
ncbi:MAG TPA: L-threonylcarbamoyladenylate synthase [Candidatus Saccharicenans sp.]|nr:threonylcarbamoyl-AMP synthase [Candidatus Saccharicenans sp.]HRD02209.1 L-threonylcarbamoyladenylate synthase [Candidatus Saccharicenans sp.]